MFRRTGSGVLNLTGMTVSSGVAAQTSTGDADTRGGCIFSSGSVNLGNPFDPTDAARGVVVRDCQAWSSSAVASARWTPASARDTMQGWTLATPGMDETTFRQLLARHWTSLFDPRSIRQGVDALRRGDVVGTRYASTPDAGMLIGQVRGSDGQPYVTGVRIRWNGEQARLDSHCSCPMQFECKHVAATVLYELHGHALGDAAERAGIAPETTPLGEWKSWLEGLQASEAAPGLAADASACECAILLRAEPGNPVLPALQAQVVRVQQGRSGGYAMPQPLSPSWEDPAPWSGLDEETFRLVSGLRMRAPTFGGSGGWFELANAADGTLLESLLATLPCFFDKVSAGRITAGPMRALRIGWLAGADGTQKLALSVDATSPDTLLLRIGGLWYFDPATREIGRVDGDTRIAQAVLRAPPLLPEQVPLLRERWRDTPLLAALPLPAAPAARRVEVEPVPVLILRSVVVAAAGAAPYRAGVVRLACDYDGLRVPMFPAQPSELVRRGGDLFEVVRNVAREVAASDLLDGTGLVAAQTLGDVPGVAAGALTESDYVVERGRQLASAEQLFPLALRLQRLGFRVETDESHPFVLLPEPEAWYAEVDDKASGATFDLRVGIEVAGEAIDLLPALHGLLSDPAFPLEARKGEAADAQWLVAVDDRRRVPLPLARLRAVIEPLLEWLQGSLRHRDGALRLRHAHADVLERLEAGLGKPWRGGDRLRAQLRRLRERRDPPAAPEGFRATLRPYQREGLGWLAQLSEAGLGGVLADDMGLGKTVQVLAHLLASKQSGRLDRPALVIAPTSLVANWHDEAARFAPDLRVLVLHGPQRHGAHAEIGNHDLVITTYPLLLRDHALLAESAYSVLVLDEAQAIKNARSQAARLVRKLDARQRIAMTGTPLENHLGELWALFDVVEPGMLGSEKQFARFFRTPIEKHGDAERQARLRQRIAPLLLRRRKEDVLSDLPPKTEIVRRVALEGGQRALYESLRLAQHERVMDEMRRRGVARSGIVVLDALLKLRQVCCDPRLVKLDIAAQAAESAKLDYLLELLSSLVEEGRRVLVFSQFAEMLALIEAALDRQGLAYQSLTGDTPAAQRPALVQRFQNGRVPLFLISLKAGGVGLNLTAADTVVHYDPWWNPAAEAQATDRAYRIGQDKPVFVYRLICADTVEERIRNLQARKAELADAMLDGAASALPIEEADIEELFAPL